MNRDELLRQAQALLPTLTDLRHRLHAIPEGGNREFQTSALIQSVLQEHSIPTKRLLDTAVVGVLSGASPGPTAALRADMDALPLTEQTGVSCASQNPGWMHACGHDFHMTAALGAALLLAQNRETLSGQVKFFFQPDEEGDGGAQRMIQAGCLAEPPVEAVFGAHVSPDLPAGTVGVRYGKFYAASNPFSVTFHGQSAHGAQPEKAVSALTAAAHAACALEALPEQLTQENGRTILSLGTLHSGTAGNIIPDTAVFSGILRTLGDDARQKAIQALKNTVSQVAQARHVTADITVRDSYPGVVNHDGMTHLVEQAAVSLLGQDKVTVLPEPTMTTEDFGYFLQNTPGCFYHIGVGGDAPLHNPCFYPADDLLAQAAALHAWVIGAFLEREDTV
jgi:amidohydrolase